MLNKTRSVTPMPSKSKGNGAIYPHLRPTLRGGGPFGLFSAGFFAAAERPAAGSLDCSGLTGATAGTLGPLGAISRYSASIAGASKASCAFLSRSAISL
jgi:hypothetical protein